MLYAREARRGVEGGVAFVGQSGGLLGHFQRAADGLGLPLAYVISTGNEAGLEGTDFLEFLADDRCHPRDRDLLRANPPAGGISRRLPPRTRGRQTDRADVSRAAAQSRARLRCRTPAR